MDYAFLVSELCIFLFGFKYHNKGANWSVVMQCILSRKMSEVSVFGFRYENTTLQKFAVENTTPQSVFVSKYDFTIVLYNKIQYHNGEM